MSYEDEPVLRYTPRGWLCLLWTLIRALVLFSASRLDTAVTGPEIARRRAAMDAPHGGRK